MYGFPARGRTSLWRPSKSGKKNITFSTSSFLEPLSERNRLQKVQERKDKDSRGEKARTGGNVYACSPTPV